jgi:hypothetical protein
MYLSNQDQLAAAAQDHDRLCTFQASVDINFVAHPRINLNRVLCDIFYHGTGNAGGHAGG